MKLWYILFGWIIISKAVIIIIVITNIINIVVIIAVIVIVTIIIFIILIIIFIIVDIIIILAIAITARIILFLFWNFHYNSVTCFSQNFCLLHKFVNSFVWLYFICLLEVLFAFQLKLFDFNVLAYVLLSFLFTDFLWRKSKQNLQRRMQLWTGKASHFSLKKIADTCSRKFDDLFSDHMTHCLTYWLTDRMSNCVTNWFSDLLTGWLTLCLINLINGLTDWLTDWMTVWLIS